MSNCHAVPACPTRASLGGHPPSTPTQFMVSTLAWDKMSRASDFLNFSLSKAMTGAPDVAFLGVMHLWMRSMAINVKC